MKRSFALLFLAFAAATAQAGSFGGPPPFTNDSPLTTGVDGSYQANARADGLTGVIRFAYSEGSQTTTAASNTYTIFVQGLVFSGPVTASIAGSSLAGVLDSENAAFSNTQMTGSFTGQFDTKSPTYFFKGGGFVQTFLEDPATNLFSTLFTQKFRFTGVRNSQTAN